MSIESIVTHEKAWEIIIKSLLNNKQEFKTIPKVNRKPVWFSAKSDGNLVYINKAEINKPSSDISTVRVLNYSNFIDVYPLFIKRENGEKVSKEVATKTRNQVYYFSLIGHIVYNYK